MVTTSPGSRRARNLEIVKGLTGGKSKSEIARDCGVTEKTVWKIVRRFEIFGLEGVLDDAPRTGPRRKISKDALHDILQFVQHNDPTESSKWTGRELAQRFNFPTSTMYRLLKELDVELDDPQTLKESCDDPRMSSMEIEGVLLSQSLSIILFARKRDNSRGSTGITRYTLNNHIGNGLTFFGRTSNSIIKLSSAVIDHIKTSRKPATEATDVSIFLRILGGRLSKRRAVFYATGQRGSAPFERIEKFVHNSHALHLKCSRGEWSDMLSDLFHKLSDTNTTTILRLENLESHLRSWLDGPRKRLGIFVWLAPTK